jgi:hypothetical protein
MGLLLAPTGIPLAVLVGWSMYYKHKNENVQCWADYSRLTISLPTQPSSLIIQTHLQNKHSVAV